MSFSLAKNINHNFKPNLLANYLKINNSTSKSYFADTKQNSMCVTVVFAL